SVSWATHARNAESAPPLNATTSESYSRNRARSAASSGTDDLDANALVALALRLGLEHADPTDICGALHMRAAVRLLVEADDVDDADLLRRVGNHVDLGADQVFVLHGGLAWQEGHLDGVSGRQLDVDELL